MSKPLKKPALISSKKEQEIIKYFKTEKDNRTSVIADYFKVSKHQVARIIEVYYDKIRMNIYD
jgi:DNA-directed RNA polymerase specialized sigma subunit